MVQNRKMLLIGILLVIVIAGAYMGYTAYGTGRLEVRITDPPKDWGQATDVYIQFSEIMVHRADSGNESGWYTVVSGLGWIDLGSTLNSSKALGVGNLQAGKYNQIRFTVEEAIVTLDGVNHTANVSSGTLKVSIIQGGVNIVAGQTSYLLIDITPKVVGSVAQGLRVVPSAKALPTMG
jgi:hypothetical protein